MANEWYYSIEGNQTGPCSEEEFQQLLTDGTISRETPVWRDGLKDWLPAGQVEGLVAMQAVPAQPAATQPVATEPPAAAAQNPYAVSPASTIGSTASLGSYPSFAVKKANFKLHLIIHLVVPAAVFLIMMIAMMGAGASASASPSGEPSDTAAAALGISFMFMMAALYISLIAGSIIGLVHLYRAWFCLQPGGAQTTPGKAVGFLFIPFFNLYWYFIAYKGFADDWNRIMNSHEDLQGAPRMQDGIFLAFAICYIVFPPLAIVFYFMAHHQICKGVNFMAARPQRGQEIRLY